MNVFFILFILGLCQNIFGQNDFITDSTGLFPRDTVIELNRTLGEFHTATGAFLKVHIVQSASDESFHDLSSRPLQQWGIEDRGILILLDRENRKVRVRSVGVNKELHSLRMEKIVTDMATHFKRDRYEVGLLLALNTSMATLRPSPLDKPGSPPESPPSPRLQLDPRDIITYLFFALFITAFFGRRRIQLPKNPLYLMRPHE